MHKEFRSDGINPSSILHIKVGNNNQPKKPVSITMPIPYGFKQGGDIRILQCDYGDDFKDVTERISFTISDQNVLFRVEHFTKYVRLS